MKFIITVFAVSKARKESPSIICLFFHYEVRQRGNNCQTVRDEPAAKIYTDKSPCFADVGIGNFLIASIFLGNGVIPFAPI